MNLAYNKVFNGVNDDKWSKYYNLSIANGVFYHQNADVSQELQGNLLEKFGAKVEGLDFVNNAAGATETINNWVRYIEQHCLVAYTCIVKRQMVKLTTYIPFPSKKQQRWFWLHRYISSLARVFDHFYSYRG